MSDIAVLDSYLDRHKKRAQYGTGLLAASGERPVRRTHASLLLLGLIFAASCVRPVAKLLGKTVEVPHFAIAVKLSNNADKRLRSIGETVKAIAYFDGDALPGQARYNPPFRDVFLGNDERLVDTNLVARFDNGRVLLSDWNRLSDKNYFVTINVVSARKATANNLLDCAEPIDQRIQFFAGKTIEVQCRLIGESSVPTG